MSDFVWLLRLARRHRSLGLGFLGVAGLVGYSLVWVHDGFATHEKALFKLARALLHPGVMLPWLWLLVHFLREPWRDPRGEVAQPARIAAPARVAALLAVALVLTAGLAAMLYGLFATKVLGGPGTPWPGAGLAVLTGIFYLAGAAVAAAGWHGPTWRPLTLLGAFAVAGFVAYFPYGWFPLSEQREPRLMALALLGTLLLLYGLALPLWERTFSPYARGPRWALPWLLLAAGAGLLALAADTRPSMERIREERRRLERELATWRAGSPLFPLRGAVEGIPYLSPKDYPPPVKAAVEGLRRLGAWAGSPPGEIALHPRLHGRFRVLYGGAGRWLLNRSYLLPVSDSSAYWTRRLISEMDGGSLARLFREAGRDGACRPLAERLAAVHREARRTRRPAWLPPEPGTPAWDALLDRACTQYRRWVLVYELLGRERLAWELGVAVPDARDPRRPSAMDARLEAEGIMPSERLGDPRAHWLARDLARELLEAGP